MKQRFAIGKDLDSVTQANPRSISAVRSEIGWCLAGCQAMPLFVL
ncbi:hypothetical protein K227x_32000 [Rubripirellula lacrimiformis]|uniref:Uncharacterized protein n=1 Tax=Rubripirellula lacrimiformis TaxID=1930273 RepID=A0A517NCC6_9BACT|nr:hypothetical protein [Rubripirellula lacrimiformis]QDT04803.1 hypothetical protein K227x_32000 [Rubripirellula lacrimiformis]